MLEALVSYRSDIEPHYVWQGHVPFSGGSGTLDTNSFLPMSGCRAGHTTNAKAAAPHRPADPVRSQPRLIHIFPQFVDRIANGRLYIVGRIAFGDLTAKRIE